MDEQLIELLPRIRFYLNEASYRALFTEQGEIEMRELRDKIDGIIAASKETQS